MNITLPPNYCWSYCGLGNGYMFADEGKWEHNITFDSLTELEKFVWEKFTETHLLYRVRSYLVGQMQYFNGAPWRDIVQAELEKMGVVVFNPYFHPFINSVSEDNNATAKLKELVSQNKYDEAAVIVKKIRGEDLRMVDLCDFVFCYINPKFPTCGAWEELFWANRMKKPIFLVIEGGKKEVPLWLLGALPHKYIYDDIDSAIKMLKNIHTGKTPIDSDRWRLLRKDKYV
jgi:hypothetical protein